MILPSCHMPSMIFPVNNSLCICSWLWYGDRWLFVSREKQGPSWDHHIPLPRAAMVICHHWWHSFRWRHNGCDSVSNHQPHHCLLNRLFRRRSKTSKLRVTGLCVGNSPGTGEFPAQMASNAENVSIWWRHHGIPLPRAAMVICHHWWHRRLRLWQPLYMFWRILTAIESRLCRSNADEFFNGHFTPKYRSWIEAKICGVICKFFLSRHLIWSYIETYCTMLNGVYITELDYIKVRDTLCDTWFDW